MSREKPKKKYEVVRTDGNRIDITYLLWALPAILFFFERGLDVAGYINFGVSWVIWGVATLVLWWCICRCVWRSRAICKFTQNKAVRWIGLTVIGVSFSAQAWRYWPVEAAPTNTDIMKAIEEARKQTTKDVVAALRKELSQIRMGVEHRLANDYPLGYVMIALSGEKKIALPYADRFESQWGKLAVSVITVDGREKICVDIPRLYDKSNDFVLEGILLSTSARPGSKSQFFGMGDLVLVLECLRSDPVGIFAVLGFAEGRGVKSTK